jgi:hypothetical protein
MKRLGWSILGGIILSVAIFLVSIPLSLVFWEPGYPPSYTNTMQKIVTFPLLWSTYLGEILFPQWYADLRQTPLPALSVAGCNVLLFSVIVYLVFPLLQAFRKKDAATAAPPEPPAFG